MTDHETMGRFQHEQQSSMQVGTRVGWMSAHRRTLVVTGSVVVALVALALGAPLSTIFFLGIVLACPLMMFGMHGTHGGHQAHAGNETALNILRERYARGELTQDQYDRMHRDLN